MIEAIPDKWQGVILAILLVGGGAGGSQVLRDVTLSPVTRAEVAALEAKMEARAAKVDEQYGDLEKRVRENETQRGRFDEKLNNIQSELTRVREGIDKLLQGGR